jgi:hypothetical protein
MVARPVQELTNQLTPSRDESITLQNQVVLPAAGNPGFDIAIPHGDNEWVLIENRYWEDEGTVSAAEIVNKHELIVKRQNNLPGMHQHRTNDCCRNCFD